MFKYSVQGGKFSAFAFCWKAPIWIRILCFIYFPSTKTRETGNMTLLFFFFFTQFFPTPVTFNWKTSFETWFSLQIKKVLKLLFKTQGWNALLYRQQTKRLVNHLCRTLCRWYPNENVLKKRDCKSFLCLMQFKNSIQKVCFLVTLEEAVFREALVQKILLHIMRWIERFAVGFGGTEFRVTGLSPLLPVEKLSVLQLGSRNLVVGFSSLHNRNSTQKSTGSETGSPVIHPSSLLRLHKYFWFS